MFPFWSSNWGNACYGNEPVSRKARLESKLGFLRSMLDDLETRLAGLNAAIDNVERQIGQDDATQV